MSKQVVEVRCEDNPHRLFTKLLLSKPVIGNDNLLEFSCRDCAKDRHVDRVLHRFNVIGELVETLVVEMPTEGA